MSSSLPAGPTDLDELVVRGDLLYRPAISVGVAEENEVSPIEMLHVAHLDSPAGKLIVRCLNIGNHHLYPLNRPRRRINHADADGDGAR